MFANDYSLCTSHLFVIELFNLGENKNKNNNDEKVHDIQAHLLHTIFKTKKMASINVKSMDSIENDGITVSIIISSIFGFIVLINIVFNQKRVQ
jgi:hypothetical protein